MDIKTLNDIMQDDLSQMVVRKLGIEGAPPAEQAELISEIVFNILARTTVEMLKVVPTDQREDYKKLLNSGDNAETMKFLQKFIPDVQVFIQHVAKKEADEMLADIDRETAELTNAKS